MPGPAGGCYSWGPWTKPRFPALFGFQNPRAVASSAYRVLALALSFAVGTSCALLPDGSGAVSGEARSRQIYVMGDTQSMSEDLCETQPVFEQMTQHICDAGYAGVIHLGDVVELQTNSSEWQVADTAFDILDACNMPYAVTMGNHDGWARHQAEWDAWLALRAYTPTRISPGGNTYLYPLFGRFWVVALALDIWRPQLEPDRRWVEEQLDALPADARVILLHHSAVHLKGPNAHAQRLAALDPRIRIVVGGHFRGAHRDRWGEMRLGDHDVVWVYANYQDACATGDVEPGWDTRLELSSDSDRVCVWSENFLTGARDRQTSKRCFD